jgi:hypothetical protein
MDEHKTISVSRTYVPNEYVVWLSPADRERLESVEGSLIEELSAYLLEHARREKLALLSRPQIEFRTDERLALGEFGIQTRLVRPSDEAGPNAGAPAEQAGHGNTMIYSTAGRISGPVEEVQGTSRAATPRCGRAAREAGRSPTSAPRTACASTAARSPASSRWPRAIASCWEPPRSRSSSNESIRPPRLPPPRGCAVARPRDLGSGTDTCSNRFQSG